MSDHYHGDKPYYPLSTAGLTLLDSQFSAELIGVTMERFKAVLTQLAIFSGLLAIIILTAITFPCR